MHRCITALFLILASLASARYLDHYATDQWRTKDMEQVRDCLDISTSGWYWSMGSVSVVFNDPADLAFTYAITTGYDVYYPHTLYQLLQAHGFTIRSKRQIERSARCGWWNAGIVRVDSHKHGSIYWKYSDLHRKPNVPDFSNSSSWEADLIDHIPPHISTVPSAATLNWIRDILVANAPTADILYTWTLVLTILLSIVSLLTFNLAAHTYMNRGTKTSQDDAGSDIELDEIRVHNLSGEGMQRMADDFHVKKRDPGISLSSPGAGSIADPPPIYTLDGARR
ncbi:hypothetical protein B5807_10288 [Epicoccum nigrum]|uniref:Uncharacterized protein n=1 Tax=Epicoccum nigrum TaxID=105696 RepID=A0A1Y2LNB6_EPING|nr:hypothetical protein B5807_10288 [Epicoccum nigrum]